MPKRNLIWIAAFIAVAVAAGVFVRRNPRTVPGEEDPDHRRFDPVVQAYRSLREHSYHPVNDHALQRGAVCGMAEAVDEFSSYVPPEHVGRFRSRLEGQVYGFGLEVERVDGSVRVIGSMAGSPAHRARIVGGERVLEIEGEEADGLTDQEITEQLHGPAGEMIELVLMDASGRRRRCELVRRRFTIETVLGFRRTEEGRWDHRLDAEGGIAYVRIREFVSATVDRLRNVLSEVSGCRGLVLDLRSNPGGRLEAGFAAANLLLRKGVIFTRVDRTGRRESFGARADGTSPYVPTVVLIDGRSASAAEIVAGALRLHDRAVLVGTRTRGKGFAQSTLVLPDGLGLINVTTAEIFVGIDRPIARRAGRDTWGVQPHRRLTLTARERRAIRRAWTAVEVADAELPAPPNSATTQPTTQPATRPARPKRKAKALDRQLALAVRLLREKGRVDLILTEAAAEREAEADRLRRARQAAKAAGEANATDDPDAHD